MRLVYTQCLPDADLTLGDDDVVVTGEVRVAETLGNRARVVLADEGFDSRGAEALNQRLCRLVHDWCRVDGSDPTEVEGVSGADLGGTEALVGVLQPAVRAVLEMQGALAGCGTAPRELVTVVAATAPPLHRRVERLSAEAAIVAGCQLVGPSLRVDRRESTRGGDAALAAKYHHTRNPEFAQDPRRLRWGVRAAAGVSAAGAALRRRRDSLAVYEYHPTAAFAASFADLPGRDVSLLRCRFGLRALPGMLAAGDRGLITAGRPGASREVAARLADHCAAHRSIIAERLTFAGVDLSDLLVPELSALAERWTRVAAVRAPRIRRALRRARTRALLVPFDTVPEARLLVRVAGSEGLPVVTINDGFKGDDHQTDGTLADFPCALSEAMARNYLPARVGDRPIRVTGDPRADGRPAPGPRLHTAWPPRRILVGSFTYSPSDLNCRRSDPERFLEQTLSGIRQSAAGAAATVTLKLHPADAPEVYDRVLAHHPEVQVVTSGDVVALFASHDVYITTYSTSLLDAAAAGLPFFYLRVNDQLLHPPFAADEEMQRRTAVDADGLAALLDSPAPPAFASDAEAWVKWFCGPRDGRCTARLLEVVQEALSAGQAASRTSITRP